MIEVFKTNIQDASEAADLIALLLQHFPCRRISFDLDDCDKVLRLDGNNLCPEQIVRFLNGQGVECTVMI